MVSPVSEYGPIKLVVIQSTSFCNLDCDYCYLPNRHLKQEFSLELLEPIFANIFTSPFIQDGFTVVWHAGEPLTMPITFYQSAREIIKKVAMKSNCDYLAINHNIQTNATLINQNWCDFFKENNIRVGVSLDGPDFIHDHHRKTRKGLGSHAATMRGVGFLQDNSIEFTVIAVLTEHSLDYPEEIFNFFVENNLKQVGFNIEEIEDYHQNSSLNKQAAETKFTNFMKTFYYLNKTHNQTLNVREFDHLKKVIYSQRGVNRGQFTPLTIISIDHQGNFMTFSPELLGVESTKYGKFALGNLAKDSLSLIKENTKFKEINQKVQEGVNLCAQTCQYFEVCGGGSPGNKYFENGDFNTTETMYCRYTKKIILDVILADLENSLQINAD
ncbi:MAG: GRRM system radical SAM/SPASM domain protein [Gloeocapsa sp. DLM2.Bin57]|nr:MAG: GRRM system radical SAM/SPASM domain protein [Gloeocapsa sp. DLM2.Bin57]